MADENKDIASEYKRISRVFLGLSDHYTPEKYKMKAVEKRKDEKGQVSLGAVMQKNEQDNYSVVKRVTKYKPVTGKNVAAGIVVLLLIAAVCFGVFVVPEIMYGDDYDNAVSLYKSGKYSEAVEILDELGNFRDCPELLLEVKYNWADSLYNNGNYKDAMEIFTELAEYSDSRERRSECTYLYADELFASGEFDEAIALYESILDYKDVSVKLEETVFENGFNAFTNGDYQRAITLLSALKDNEEAKQLVIISKAYLMDQTGNADPDAISTIMANIGAMDTDIARLALELDVFTAEKLSGTWKSADGLYSLSLDRSNKTLEIIMPIGYSGTDFKIEDKIIYVQDESEEWNACLLIESFEPNNVSQPTAVNLYNYFDQKRYTLYR